MGDNNYEREPKTNFEIKSDKSQPKSFQNRKISIQSGNWNADQEDEFGDRHKL